MKNLKMANKGMLFEEEVKIANITYSQRKVAKIQKVSTPWVVIRSGKDIVNAFPESKSTLDFRGTVNRGISISFDCKESEDERGLPLAHIPVHQIDYIREALEVGEICFILTLIKPLNKRFLIKGEDIIRIWDIWKENKGKRGFNIIKIEDMFETKARNGIMLDYLSTMATAYNMFSKKEA